MNMQSQEMDQWCWAAVSVSVDRFFDPASGSTQCLVAEKVLGRKCCADKASCDEPAALQDALTQVRRLKKTVGRRLRFSEIQAEIDAARPVCVRIGWFGGGGHFVVIDEYTELKSGAQLVHVLDPLFANSTVYYDEFVSDYQGDGQWTGTFLVS